MNKLDSLSFFKGAKGLVLFLLVLSVSLFISCTEDTGTNNPPENVYYFPLSINSYWIADNYKLDKNSSRIDSTYYSDSAVVTGTQQLSGKTTYKITTFRDGNEKEANYFYSDSTSLYSNLLYILPSAEDLGFEIPIDNTDSLVLIADLNKVEWKINETLISNLVVNFQSIQVTLNGTFTIKGQQGGTKTLTVQNRNIKAKEFVITHTFDGKATVFSFPVDLKFTLTVHYFYGENANLLQSKLDPVSIGVSTFTQDVDGFESSVVRFNIAK